MPEQLILFPFGGNAREALMTIQSSPSLKERWDVIGFIDDDPRKQGNGSAGVKVLGERDILAKYPEAKVLAVPGNAQTFLQRAEVIDNLGIAPDRWASIIDDSAKIAPDVIVQSNTLIMANVVISCGVSLGMHCVVLPNTVISHDCSIGDYSSLAAQVTVAGGVQIGANCYIGAGSNIRENITLSPRCLVGMGSNVLADVPEASIVFGNPAKIQAEVTR